MDNIVKSVIAALVYIIAAPFVGALLAGVDRKITARMQGRRGPSVLQPFWDVEKLLKKETKTINRVQILYLMSFLIFVVITGALFFGGYDLLLVFFTLTTANIFLVIAASSGHSPMVLITVIGLYCVTGNFKVSQIVISDNLPPVVYLLGIFVGFMFILTIKLRKHPFDLSTSHHAHQELVKGLTTEFNGQMFAIVEISHWYENVFLLGVLALFFLHGNGTSVSPISIIITIIALAVCYFIEILIDNTNARLKWDQMLKSAWIVTAVLGALNLIILEVVIGGMK